MQSFLNGLIPICSGWRKGQSYRQGAGHQGSVCNCKLSYYVLVRDPVCVASVVTEWLPWFLRTRICFHSLESIQGGWSAVQIRNMPKTYGHMWGCPLAPWVLVKEDCWHSGSSPGFMAWHTEVCVTWSLPASAASCQSLPCPFPSSTPRLCDTNHSSPCWGLLMCQALG